MRTARPLGLSPDGSSLIVVVDGGEQLAIPADDRLRAALRNDRARMGQLEIEMESALRPRDIQARIRSGESLEAVAQAAGVPPEQIEPFAAPVIAEREHIAGLAQANPVRRAGDAVAHRSLRAVVTDRLLSRGVDADSVDWDAWRSGERRWTVRLGYESGSAHREADFDYDQTGRFSVAANDDARWLTGEHSAAHGPQPGRKRRGDEPNDDQTVDLNDELAIVRAIQPQFEVTPDLIDEDDDLGNENLLDDRGRSDQDDGAADSEDAFAEGDLAEVDGVYDIVPGDRSSMDVLYDMLSGFDEDSVQIYAGLVRPDPEAAAAPVLDNGPKQPDLVIVETVDVIEIMPEDEDEDDQDAADKDDEDAADEDDALFAAAHVEHSPHADETLRDVPLDDGDGGTEVQPVAEQQPSDEIAAPAAEPEQPGLVDHAADEPSRPIKRKRASVPSWDEIMFGSPKPKE